MVSLWRFVALFIAAVLVYSFVGFSLLHRLIDYIKSRRPDAPTPSRPSDVRKWAERVAVGLAVLGTVMLMYSFYEPYWPQVETITLKARGLAPGRPIVIAQISDTHCDPRPRLEERLPGLIAELKPDLIVFTGDAVNCEEGGPIFRKMMKELSKVAPVYAVLGNWEVWWFGHVDLYGDTKVKLLVNRSENVTVDGRGFHIAGISVDNESLIPRVVGDIPKNEFCLFLHHYPSACTFAERYGADVALCGDTHGGQSWLPILGELVRIKRHGRWLPRGQHRVGEMELYVNRGIGMEGGAAPRVRFMTRPEITLVRLLPEAAAGPGEKSDQKSAR